jgi:cytoskeletal protein CcmA (bactofilin family)
MKKLFVVLMAFVLVSSVVSSVDARVIVKDKSVVKMGEDINMGSDLMFKDVVAIKGNVNIKGDVGGDVVAVLGNVHLYPTAKVAGDVVCISGTITRDKGAIIKGEITEIGMNKEAVNMAIDTAPMMACAATGGFLVMKSLMFIGFLGLAALLISFFMSQLGSISSKAESQWLKCLLWGILGELLIVPVAVLLAITIVGIPLILIEVLLISIAMIMGNIAIAHVIGKKFANAVRKPNQPMLTEAVAGLIILFLIDLIPVVGGIVKWGAITTGFGAAILTKLGTK